MRLNPLNPAILSTATRSQLIAFRLAIYEAQATGRLRPGQLDRLDQLANEREAVLNAERDAHDARREPQQAALALVGTIAAAEPRTGSQRALWPSAAPFARRSPFSSGKRSARSPDRKRSARRRCNVAQGKPLPEWMQWEFTEHERAVLEIVSRDHIARGCCTRFMGEIAALAGVSESTARRAMQRAADSGLLDVRHRPRPGAPHLSNVATIVSPDWREWLAKRPKPLRPEPKPVLPKTSPFEAARRPLPIEGGGRVSARMATENPTTQERENPTSQSLPKAARRESEPPDRPPRTV